MKLKNPETIKQTKRNINGLVDGNFIQDCDEFFDWEDRFLSNASQRSTDYKVENLDDLWATSDEVTIFQVQVDFKPLRRQSTPSQKEKIQHIINSVIDYIESTEQHCAFIFPELFFADLSHELINKLCQATKNKPVAIIGGGWRAVEAEMHEQAKQTCLQELFIQLARLYNDRRNQSDSMAKVMANNANFFQHGLFLEEGTDYQAYIQKYIQSVEQLPDNSFAYNCFVFMAQGQQFEFHKNTLMPNELLDNLVPGDEYGILQTGFVDFFGAAVWSFWTIVIIPLIIMLVPIVLLKLFINI